ncbi:Rieske domain protein [Ophiocordyceps camponoti-floridani]|uniref:Rieske domain protein n=1 Tax=Ophiocordyceps camponoti-floridani TaxID=2030778 RepID=A0A8H4Q1X4_9HYPO|nr:Rieske domain protein [Ophiocordyceps camponoti-floridani]
MTSRTDWFCVGKASTFSNLESEHHSSQETSLEGRCKAFTIPQSGQRAPTLTECSDGDTAHVQRQVLVFAYRGRIHAINHSCPHSSFPLSRGAVFDIEDFGVVLSAGVTCAKHGWSFDLFSGRGDRGNYSLGLWDVDLRGDEGADKEVWVRRRAAS